LNGQGLKGTLERGEGSKAHSKEVKVQRRTQKEVEKYIEFSGGPILVGGLPRSKKI
jgi:hypothetical protein